MGPLDGRTLGHFRVERMIGSGGMGAVYEAVDEKLERQVALKVLLEEGNATPNRKRFLREARLAAKLTHPNIATVFEVGEFEDHLYIVMELLEGQSLRKLLFGQRLSTEQSIGIARDMARALAKAHAAGITHRDIKPENVFITTPAPGVLTAKVLDFGLARQERDRPKNPALERSGRREEDTATGTTAPGDVLGTPGYWSPEQARSSDVDLRTDVFSFGIVLYEMLTGRQAFRANTTVALVLAVTRHEPEAVRKYVPNIAPQLEELVARCIKKEPAERFADGGELLAAVEAVARALGRTSSFDLDDVTAADDEPPVRPFPDVPRPPPSAPAASAPTPGPTTLEEMAAPATRHSAVAFIPPERMKLFAAIGAGLAGAGLLLILLTVVFGSAGRMKAAGVARSAAGSGSASAMTAPPGTVTAGTVTPLTVTVPATPRPSGGEPRDPAAAGAGPPETPPAPALAPPEPPITPTPLATAVTAVTAAPRPLSTSGTGTGSAGGARPHGDRKGDCAQPFTVDAKGVKIPKLHCL